MIRAIGNLYALVMGWPALARFNRLLNYLSGRALGLHNYENVAISGEQIAIRLGLGRGEAPIVFDIGANRGDWTSAVLSARATARVHAFEPQAALARALASRCGQAKVNNMALGEAPGTLQLFDYAEHAGSEHASLLAGVIDGIHRGNARAVSVEVGTVDDYCAVHGIERIDLLKIDVEGFELKVLNGAKRMLAERRVDTIQFEFNEMNIVGRTFMNDFFGCLGASHDLYRLLPHGLLPLRQDAHWSNEQFTFQNIVARPRRQESP